MRVPIASVRQDPVRSPGLSDPRVVPVDDATGQQLQGLGQGVAQLGAGLMRAGVAWQRDIDDAKITQAQNLFADTIRQQMRDPASGYLNTVGGDAIGGRREATFEAIREAGDRIAAGLSNKEQREAFDVARQQRLLDAQLDADAHESRQARVFRVGQLEAQAANFIDEATSAVGTPDFAVRKEGLRVTVADLGEARGMSPAEVKRAQMEATTKLHGQVLQGFIANGRGSEARAYLDENAGEIDPGAQPRWREAVKRAGINEESQQLAFKIIGEAGSNESPESYALSIAEYTYKGKRIPVEVYDETVQRLQKHYDQERKATAVENVNLLNSAQAWLTENKLQPVEAFPDYESLKSRGLVDSVNNFARNGRYVTDPRTLYEVDSMTPAQWRSMSDAQVFARFRGSLDDSDLNYARARHASAFGTIKGEGLVVLDKEDRISEAARKLGIDKVPESKYLLREEVQKRVKVWEAANGKKADNEQLQSIIDTVIVDKARVSQSFLFDFVSPDDEVPTFMLSPDQQESAYVNIRGEALPLRSIPPAQRAQITRSLLARGLPVTEQAIAELWDAAGRLK